MARYKILISSNMMFRPRFLVKFVLQRTYTSGKSHLYCEVSRPGTLIPNQDELDHSLALDDRISACAQNEMNPTFGLHNTTDLPWTESVRSLFERSLHLAFTEPTEIAVRLM